MIFYDVTPGLALSAVNTAVRIAIREALIRRHNFHFQIIMQNLAIKLHQLRTRISAACEKAGRPADAVTLLAVSKTFGPEAIREVAATGQRAFGENYVQEALDKIEALRDHVPALEWHLIGPLQSNKTRVVAEAFDWVHSIDRLKTAQRLSEQRPAHLPPLQVCIQVNISAQETKSGVAPGEVLALAQAIAALPNVRLRGLMAIPEPSAEPEAQREPHRMLRELFHMLRAQGLALDTLSMGMSGDLEAAIAEGSTIVRVGSAIFGSRTYAAA